MLGGRELPILEAYRNADTIYKPHGTTRIIDDTNRIRYTAVFTRGVFSAGIWYNARGVLIERVTSTHSGFTTDYFDDNGVWIESFESNTAHKKHGLHWRIENGKYIPVSYTNGIQDFFGGWDCQLE